MYKIIGGDQKEYGPVTADELRRWISEGRLNGQSLIREGEGDWQPLSSFPEFADALQAQVGGPFAAGPAGSPAATLISSAEILARSPQVQIGRCLSLSWSLLTANFGLLCGATFLAWLLLLVQLIPLVGPIFYLLMSGVLYGGLYLVFLRRIRGQPASVADVFAGFTVAFGQLVLVGLVSGLLTGIGMCCCIPGIYLLVAWTFSIPLVADQRLEFWSAMEVSRKVVTRVWFPMLGLLILAFLPALVAYLVIHFALQSPSMPGLEEMIKSGQLDPKRLIEMVMEAAKSNVKRVLLEQFVLLLNLPFAVGALMYAYENLFGTRPAPPA